MASQPSHVDANERLQPLRKKARLSAPSSKSNTPNAYSRRSPPREAPRKQGSRSASPIADSRDRADVDGDRSPPRKLKRPGAGARIAASNVAAAEAARQRREAENRQAVSERNAAGAAELVASHYNAVPERGREWRKTDSQIKGLRSLNNWVKSTLIQKFSVAENMAEGAGTGGRMSQQPLLVLDMACGKGGDLGKWEKAPKVPALYVGCDIADISIDQARGRYDESVRKSRGRGRDYRGGSEPMQAEFYVHDAFSRPLSDIVRIRQVGFNPNAGPGNGLIQGGMATGGFDVVSMMFALHYSYESEALARGMLKNVSGALKKGGRFFGVMPNSDVLSATVKQLLQGDSATRTPNGNAAEPVAGEEEGEIKDDSDAEWDPEKSADVNGSKAVNAADNEDDWDPEKPSEPQTEAAIITNGTPTNGALHVEDDDWDPEKPSEPTPNTSQALGTPVPATTPNGLSSSTPAAQLSQTTADLPPIEWGNTLYTVRMPQSQPLTQRPLPKDGIFRPPYGWRYHYHLAEAVDVPEFIVPWEAFRALAEEYGLELMYRKGFREVLNDEGIDGEGELGRLAERMGVLRRERGGGRLEVLVGEDEMEAASFYHAFCFYRT